jgi:hypothetical protein
LRRPDLPTKKVGRTFAPAPEKPGIVQKVRLGTSALFAQVAPDGRTFITGDGSGGVDLYETATGKVIQTFPGWMGAYADGGRKIVTVRHKGEDFVGVYDLATGQLDRKFGKVAAGAEMYCLVSLAGGTRALTWDSLRNFRLFDITTGTELVTWRHASGWGDFTYTADGKRLFVWGSGQDRYTVYDTATGKKVDEFAALTGVGTLFNFSADGLTVQVRTVADGGVVMALEPKPVGMEVRRVADGQRISVAERPTAGALMQNVSPDRTKQVFVLPDGTVELRDAVNWRLLNAVKVELPCPHDRFVYRAAMSQGATSDGKFAILNTRDADGHVVVIRFPDLPSPKP